MSIKYNRKKGGKRSNISEEGGEKKKASKRENVYHKKGSGAGLGYKLRALKTLTRLEKKDKQ